MLAPEPNVIGNESSEEGTINDMSHNMDHNEDMKEEESSKQKSTSHGFFQHLNQQNNLNAKRIHSSGGNVFKAPAPV